MDAKDEPIPQLVVLGSSAGGIDALSDLLERIGPEFPAPILIAQHLDPSRRSRLSEILQRRTKAHIKAVDGEIEIEPGTAYVLPTDHPMEVHVGRISVGGEDGTRPTPSIDRIFASAANAYGEGLTVVILSGTGSDGAAGVRHVKAAGGTVVIQNPDTASFPAMPLAIPASLVDIVADSEAIGPLLVDLVATPRVVRRGDEERRLLRTFLEDLRVRSGIDFESYKRGTILRRLHRRMLAAGVDGLREYITYVRANPDEYQRLASSFLIKVTEFFRDADLFDHLRDAILPQLLEQARANNRELRFWSAGCATGEEAYSLAILLAEALGDELPVFNVRIFATDVDLDAIAFARRGVYAEAVLAAVSDDLRERHFTKVGDQYEVRKHIRAMTVFGQHDLGQRAPFPRVDLALCRNVLIYFTSELQKRALHLFAFALRDGGFLVLGKAESTSPLPQHFVLAHPRLKIYRREGDRVLIPPARIRDTAPLVPLRLPSARRPGWTDVPSAADGKPSVAERWDQLVLQMPVGVIVVNREYDVQIINSAARRQLGIHGQAIGDDLIHLLDPAIGTPLKAAIDAVNRGRPVDPLVVDVAPASDAAGARSLEFAVQVLQDDRPRSKAKRVVIACVDVTSGMAARRGLEEGTRSAQAERDAAVEQGRQLGRANTELLDANEELTAANAELRTANEQLLVSNEEVQAATEEVETLNEELQATNEELETLNEELQATVEELNTTNDDLEARTIELQQTAMEVEHRRVELDDERSQLLGALDAIDEPVLVVDAAGAIVKANRPFRDRLGDPELVELLDEGGRPFERAANPLLRASKEAFEVRVRAGDDSYVVAGRPLDGNGGYGALIVRSAGD